MQFFFLEIAPQKGSQGDAVYIVSALKVFEEDKAEETDESGGQVHPPNVGRGKQNLVCITEAVRLKMI